MDQGFQVVKVQRELLLKPEMLKEFFEKEKPDYIFHLASYGNHYHQGDIELIIKTNIIGTFNMLMASKDINYKSFVNFSSSSVDLPYETFYSTSKASGEHIVNAFFNEYEKCIITIRPASVFGEGEADFRLIPVVIKSLLTGKKINLDKKSTHSWIYIHDFIDALLYLFDKDIKMKPINISYGKQWTNLEIIQMLEKISGKTLNYEKIDNMRSYDNTNWLVKNKELRRISWKPKYDIYQGLKKTYEYYQKKYEK